MQVHEGVDWATWATSGVGGLQLLRSTIVPVVSRVLGDAAMEAVLQFRVEAEKKTVQLRGRATLGQAATLRRFGEACASEGVALRFDLRHCTYLDSTMLGTLLCLNRSLARKGTALTLVSPTQECLKVLRQVGLDTMLPLVDEAEPIADWSPLPIEKESNPTALKRQLVECHEELARMGGSLSEQFRLAAECLGREL